MIRLIASDMDGTLLQDGGHSINPEYHPVIQSLLKQGIFFVGASGRQFHSIAELFPNEAQAMYFITDGGGALRSYTQVLKAFALEETMLAEMVQDALTLPGCDVMLCGLKHSYVRQKDSRLYRWLVDGYHFQVELNPTLACPPGEQIVKLSIYHPTDTEAIVNEWFAPKWGDKVQIASAGIQWMDCVSLKANKGNALAALQQRLGISPEETMVFGDNINDIPMLKQAKYSYAVENARQECKDAANFDCPGWRENGVLQVLRQVSEGKVW